MARLPLTGITVAIDGVAQDASTTIGTVGGHAVIVATALPELGVTLTSSYLSALVGDIAASHLCSMPGGPPVIDQHVLPTAQLGQTHAQACLLDHVAELRDVLEASTPDAATVSATIADDTLQRADHAWQDPGDPPA